ncbi:Uncharacterised protein [Serratia quinivorans]|jgi:hypothetical protein|nr:Uncharacterised protein [Serratia quinivorans]
MQGAVTIALSYILVLAETAISKLSHVASSRRAGVCCQGLVFVADGLVMIHF